MSDAMGKTENGFRVIRPRWFFAGLVLGLVALGWLGRQAGKPDFHPDFVRFHPPISPEGNYYPTVDEMCAIVRARYRPEQVLVIVGGNSILHGVWQPVEELWTKRLQERLGDKFCVVNFALRGATPTDGAAVIAEVLREEFPRQIYITNERPKLGAGQIGGATHRWLFWEAYFGGRLLTVSTRDQRAWRELTVGITHPQAVEIVSTALLDRVLHYRNFWNRVGFERMFTVPSLYAEAIPALLAPRKLFADVEVDATAEPFRSQRYSPAGLEAEMAITRATTALHYHRETDGGWAMNPASKLEMTWSTEEAFPGPLKARTLLLLSLNSPFYRRYLTTEERARDDQATRDSLGYWQRAGHRAIAYGREWTDDDYGDRTHLSKLGARKLAELVAPEVEAMVKQLGYLK